MKINEILEAYKLQLNNLLALVEVVKEKQQMLVSAKHGNLNSIIVKEERALLAVQEAEKKRLKLTSELLREMNPKSTGLNQPIKLSRVLKGIITNEEMEELVTRESEIRNALVEINEINQYNSFLINHVRNFLNEAVSCLLGNQKRSLIDRKV